MKMRSAWGQAGEARALTFPLTAVYHSVNLPLRFGATDSDSFPNWEIFNRANREIASVLLPSKHKP